MKTGCALLLAVLAACTTTPTSERSAHPSAAPTPLASPSTPPSTDGFTPRISPLSDAARAHMLATKTWRAGCPVQIEDLRSIRVTYWSFDDVAVQGTIVMNADAADVTVGVFRALFDAKVPIRRMRPVEFYEGDDDRSMAADNTSGFNCRIVEGFERWSQHAYGRAIDINPLENPYIFNKQVLPLGAKAYVDRTLRARGMIHDNDAVVRAFDAAGWKWGGRWVSLKDYQHFSANGF